MYGYNYVMECLREEPDSPVVRFWADFYGIKKEESEDEDMVPVYPGHQCDYEHIRTWEGDEFTLHLWCTFSTVRYGPQERLAYQLWDGDTLIFEGEDYGCSPLNAIDSDASVSALLSFLSLRPGDTDEDYFDSYNNKQIEWRDSGRAEELSFHAIELEVQDNDE